MNLRNAIFLIPVLLLVIPAGRGEIVYFSDFEADNGGLTSSVDWEWGDYAWTGGSCYNEFFPPDTAYSGTRMWGTILNDCYSDLANNADYASCVNQNPDDDAILSVEVDLTGYGSATLSFYEWQDIFMNWDWAEVYVNDAVVYQHCGTGFVPSTEWGLVELDISEHAGGMITVEFHLLTSSVVNHAGWYIEDLKIEAAVGGPTVTATPTQENTPTTPPNTATPTNPPAPTFTPTNPPAPTFTPTNPPAPTSTPTPIPTFTPPPPTATSTHESTATPQPTNTPEETATPEPTATPHCTILGCSIFMPSHDYEAGDECYCDVVVCNPGPETMADVPVFVLLDVYGSYFFAPGFTEFDHYTMTIEPELTVINVLPPFSWPSGAGAASGVKWYAAMTDAGVTTLVGEFDMFEFGWH